ncbi:MAG TPA: tetratricopeptide repeat protein [Candidatus Latescibacteria bacterium]|nr:hypothetical protein [Gemmatimonadaceae bacterium]MDP6014547.1 tetratricopeptide repeat protein [Candidatus Latescibacterota bacterium]HJP31476.1 tetratricopeptide repeat protein [Candidatus Latescibacterota bacterium]
MTESDAADARTRALVFLLLCVLGLAAFHNSLDVPFLHDDEAAIVDNPHIRQLWPFGADGDQVQTAETGRPVVRLSLALNYALGELDVTGYHLFNLGVHVLSAWVLFRLLRRTLSLPSIGLSRGRAVELAAISAALWLVHPLQVDAVTYVIQRTELLMGLFFLLTLYASSVAFDSPHRLIWSSVAVLCCVCGMLSKEAMASAPILVGLYDRAYLNPDWRQLIRLRWRLYAALAAGWLPLAAIVLSGPRDQTVGFDLGLAWWQYGATQLEMITHYLALVFWPADFILDYGRYAGLDTADLAVAALVIGMLLGATLWALRHRPDLGFPGAAFFLILAPSSSVIPIVTEIGAERRMHLPLAAVVVVVVVLLDHLLPSTSRRRVRLACAGLAIITLLSVTVGRNEVFVSDLTIWRDTVAKVPDNCSARNNLGRAYFDRGQLDEAIAEFAAAVQLPHCDAQVYGNLGKALIEMGQVEQAGRYFEELLRVRPHFWRAHEGLGIVHLRQRRWAEAIAAFELCVDNGYHSADLYTNLGMALFQLDEPAAAARQMRQALALDPEHTIATENLRLIVGEMGEAGERVDE